MTENESLPIRWSVEQRLAFIERRLYWEGQINRADLINHFSISTPQASADLAHYDQIALGNMSYDKRAKTYIAMPEFNPRMGEPSARQYLAQLQLLADDVLNKNESWLGSIPSNGVVPRVRRRMEASVLRSVLEAIRLNRGLQICYQSMRSEQPSTRWIVAHALNFDGYRWHVRAWCYSRNKFLDFVLARVLNVIDSREDSVDSTLDIAWHTMITLRLGANPLLTRASQRAIALDYGMNEGFVEVKVRLSLVYYLKRQMLLDIVDTLGPERAQIVLLNADEVNTALQAVGESTN